MSVLPPRNGRRAPFVASRSGGRRRSGRQPPRLRLSVVGSNHYPDLPARSTLRRWVGMALLGRNAQINLVFVNRQVGRRLNRQFRARDYPTNVLTFAYQKRPTVVAELVLCVPVVRREALEQGKTVLQHLAHMVVHGVLHAQGHDHANAQESRRMRLLERRFLAHLRIPDPYA